MRIERVEIQGFRSFRSLEVFDFTSQPGLVLLTGRNEDEPSLGANGAGKSSMWEAVFWCLFGTTSVGLKGPEVATWSVGQGVYVLVRIDGQSVVRTWSPNALTIDGEEAEQSTIDELVGLTKEQFLACTYIAQRGDSFLDLGASAKTDLIASVLDLERWLRYSEQAAARASTTQQELDSLQSRMTALKARISELEDNDLRDQHEAWCEQNALERVQCEIDLRRAEEDYEVAYSRARDAQTAVDADTTAHRSALGLLDESRADVVALRDRERAARQHHDHLEHIHNGNRCPTCKQSVPTDDRATAADVHAALDRAVRILRALQQAEADVERCQRSVSSTQQRLQASRDALLEALQRVSAARETLEARAGGAQAARSAVSPYMRMLREREERLGRFRASELRLQSAIDSTREELDAVTPWVRGFKDVRLFLVAEAMAQLEVEVNSALHALGLREWRMTFAPDAETKSGGVKRGFAVMIESPMNQRPVPWSAWSGGEAQRLRLAVTMGISNLIAAYTGYRAFVEVWDEPSTGMSAEGIADMLEALRARAIDNARQVWVVDHRALDSGAFIETVVAVKQSGTTALIKEPS